MSVVWGFAMVGVWKGSQVVVGCKAQARGLRIRMTSCTPGVKTMRMTISTSMIQPYTNTMFSAARV